MKANELIQQITEQVHQNANVRVVFGDAIDKGDITIIPVAKVTVKGGGGGGFGGPGGSVSMSAGIISQAQSQSQRAHPEEKPFDSTNQEPKKSGSGGGMGLGLEISTTPLGYIQIKNGEARYKEIVDTTKIALSGMFLAGFMMLMFTRIVVLIVRKFKTTSPKKLPKQNNIQK
jgi:uncharacterized spore protein YtfJ